MTPIPHLVGMIHLEALPGSPRYQGSMDRILESALADARLLTETGFPALMVENFGDAPFFAEAVPPETVASLTRAVSTLIRETGVPVGVNVLRNDALSAIAIAAATGAAMIRVNVHTGTMYTDQGPIVGRAADLLRKKQHLGCEAEIWADLLVKHATPPPGLDTRQISLDTLERGMADALIISGTGTGSAPDLDRLGLVREAVGTDVRLVVGSGSDPENLGTLAALADTFIIGSYTKHNGVATNTVDRVRASRIVDAAQQSGIV